jgi:hypothetical protein
METNWAAEHLQVIRTLMERSVLYRRALAPIMMVNGIIGIGAAATGYLAQIEANRTFSLYWICISLVALSATFLLARRQALKDAEPFWSPPTRRVTHALLPTFFVGLFAALLFVVNPPGWATLTWFLAITWTMLYGFALHSAGFFMQRGIKLLGWIFVVGSCVALFAVNSTAGWQTSTVAHLIMGVFFGLVHLAYSVYLYFTEKANQTA